MGPRVKSSFVRVVVVLGLLSALGPFAIDMYLPGLPSIGATFHVSDATVQVSLMVYILAASTSQLIFGPLSDLIGRKMPIYMGLVVFALASAGCALANDIDTLIAFRALQGVGACAGMVIPRAVVRDLHTGPEAVQLMGLLMLVFSVSPILAPLFGSFVVASAGWRAVFWIIGAAAAAGVPLTLAFLPETRTAAARRTASVGGAFRDYLRLMQNAEFVGLAAVGGFSFSAFLVFLANSSFVLIGHYGLSSKLYSVAFSLNAFAFIGAAQLNGWLVRHFSQVSLVRSSAVGLFLASGALAVISYGSLDSLAVLLGLLFLTFVFMGFIVPNVTVLSLENHGEIAGTASALMGTIQMLIGVVMVGIASVFSDGKPLPMVTSIAVCAFCTLCVTLASVRKARARLEEVSASDAS
jgi:DHA1 family bicyclomycin/chloramphenicol resistance-like MFS transporter